jgi:Zn-dependent M28 family amino/carboxypeptidase
VKPNCLTTVVRGEIRGDKYPDEVIILGAHHDTVGAMGMPPAVNSPGACDNASAVSILIELARMYEVDRPSRTLWLCSFGGEERHLIGSSAYARVLNEARELGRVIAYLGVDQAAYGDVLRLLSSEDEPHLEPQIDLREMMRSAADELRLNERFNTYGPGPVHAASDHWPFFYSGIPAFLTGWHPFDGWHRHTDSFDLCTEDDEYLATADLLQQMLERVCALPRIGPIERSPAAGYVLHAPAVES